MRKAQRSPDLVSAESEATEQQKLELGFPWSWVGKQMDRLLGRGTRVSAMQTSANLEKVWL